jgi:integrase
MGIYRHKGKWRAEVWVDDQRLASKAGFETKELAKEWHNRLANDFKIDPERIKAPKKHTFNDLLENYQKIHMPTISAETRRRYLTDIDFRIREHFQFRPLDSITPLMIEAFRGQIMEAGLQPKSVNNCMELLRSMFRKGEEWGMLEKSPFRLRSLKIQQQKYSWWEKKEHIAAFLKEAKADRYYAAYKLSLECGLRLGEIVGLSKQDINFERDQIHIHRQWLNREECYGPTKGRRERFVYLHPSSDLKDALMKAVEMSPHTEAIFVTARGERVRPRRLAARHFQRVVELAGVPRIRFHDLRHTFASWYMIEVGDIWSLKGILGHVDVQTTQRYAHLSSRRQVAPPMSWIADGAKTGKKFPTHYPHTKSDPKPNKVSKIR